MERNQAPTLGKTHLDYILWSRDISNVEFAKQVGVHDTVVSRWRKGLVPPPDKRKLIARKLKVSLADLGWEEPSHV